MLSLSAQQPRGGQYWTFARRLWHRSCSRRRLVKSTGLAALNTSRAATVTAISCPTGGHCTAGGYYADRADLHAFVVSES